MALSKTLFKPFGDKARRQRRMSRRRRALMFGVFVFVAISVIAAALMVDGGTPQEKIVRYWTISTQVSAMLTLAYLALDVLVSDFVDTYRAFMKKR